MFLMLVELFGCPGARGPEARGQGPGSQVPSPRSRVQPGPAPSPQPSPQPPAPSLSLFRRHDLPALGVPRAGPEPFPRMRPLFRLALHHRPAAVRTGGRQGRLCTGCRLARVPGPVPRAARAAGGAAAGAVRNGGSRLRLRLGSCGRFGLRFGLRFGPRFGFGLGFAGSGSASGSGPPRFGFRRGSGSAAVRVRVAAQVGARSQAQLRPGLPPPAPPRPAPPRRWLPARPPGRSPRTSRPTRALPACPLPPVPAAAPVRPGTAPSPPARQPLPRQPLPPRSSAAALLGSQPLPPAAAGWAAGAAPRGVVAGAASGKPAATGVGCGAGSTRTFFHCAPSAGTSSATAAPSATSPCSSPRTATSASRTSASAYPLRAGKRSTGTRAAASAWSTNAARPAPASRPREVSSSSTTAATLRVSGWQSTKSTCFCCRRSRRLALRLSARTAGRLDQVLQPHLGEDPELPLQRLLQHAEKGALGGGEQLPPGLAEDLLGLSRRDLPLAPGGNHHQDRDHDHANHRHQQYHTVHFTLPVAEPKHARKKTKKPRRQSPRQSRPLIRIFPDGDRPRHQSLPVVSGHKTSLRYAPGGGLSMLKRVASGEWFWTRDSGPAALDRMLAPQSLKSAHTGQWSEGRAMARIW